MLPWFSQKIDDAYYIESKRINNVYHIQSKNSLQLF